MDDQRAIEEVSKSASYPVGMDNDKSNYVILSTGKRKVRRVFLLMENVRPDGISGGGYNFGGTRYEKKSGQGKPGEATKLFEGQETYLTRVAYRRHAFPITPEAKKLVEEKVTADGDGTGGEGEFEFEQKARRIRNVVVLARQANERDECALKLSPYLYIQPYNGYNDVDDSSGDI
ncbi:hypothetical protein HZH66_012434 [Vespula vulgaris]|uniref:Uncharacterized protein n=1 Tax=Vespula vulgaris TaxID=7454 RepID=A0A834MUI2_VESVU|nr:hypothetical protein HZH66_012434 [Vespula vulgaris]